MKESKIVKVILVMVISLFVILLAKDVLAAEGNNSYIDFTSTVFGNNTTGNNTTGNNTTGNNTTGNSSVLKTNNTSNYNNTSLPETGIADSVPGVILVVVLGISSVYAYKKIQYYKNI